MPGYPKQRPGGEGVAAAGELESSDFCQEEGDTEDDKSTTDLD